MATTPTRYSDIDLNFTPHPVTGDIVRKTDAEAVKQSIKNLVLLNFYEKPFQPDIGSNVIRLLFELASPFTAINIANAIRQVIQNYEPRAEEVRVKVSSDDSLHRYDVTIEFAIKNLEIPVSFNMFLDRVR